MPRSSPRTETSARRNSARVNPIASTSSPVSATSTLSSKSRVTSSSSSSRTTPARKTPRRRPVSSPDIDNESAVSNEEPEQSISTHDPLAIRDQPEASIIQDLASETFQGPADTRDLFYRRIYATVRLIPPGKVCTYGHLAKLAGRPKNSRLVGQALRFLPRHMAFPPESAEAAGGDPSMAVPWHRVINSRGVISARGSIQAVRRQADWLRDEGVEVDEDGEVDPEELNPLNPHDQFAIGAMEGGRVSLRRFGWFPDEVSLIRE